MDVKVRLQALGRPLRDTYVEHIVAGVGTEMYMTDDQGSVCNKDSDEGIDSWTPQVDIRIICQNPVLRVLDGDAANIGVYQDRTVNDGDVVNLANNQAQQRHYDILDRALRTYEFLFQHVDFFRSMSEPSFPLGRVASLRDTRDRVQRIDLSYPDHFLAAERSFVEPKRFLDDYPLIHLKHTDSLFGENGAPPTLIPAELAHALHFAFLSPHRRQQAQDKYFKFLVLGELGISPVGPGHAFTVRTTNEVAFIEAFEHYATRYSEFVWARRGSPPLLSGPPPSDADEDAFLMHEMDLWAPIQGRPPDRASLDPRRLVDAIRAGGGAPLDVRLALQRWRRVPRVTGGDVEGAVYMAIFVSFARHVGLNFAVSSYLDSNAITFGQYRAHIMSEHPQFFPTLERARRFWGI